MSPRKSTRSSAHMKQSKLSFASKRTASSTADDGKHAKSTRKQPSRTPSTSASASSDVILISDSDSEDSYDEERTFPAPKKRRLGSTGPKGARKRQLLRKDEKNEAVEPQPEREHLDTSDHRWRKLYGVAREKMGNLEAIHAEGQSMVHHILRVFDLSYEYGPCVGISRLDRWERAQTLGLNPPPEVKEILLTKEGVSDEELSQSVFYGEV